MQCACGAKRDVLTDPQLLQVPASQLGFIYEPEKKSEPHRLHTCRNCGAVYFPVPLYAQRQGGG